MHHDDLWDFYLDAHYFHAAGLDDLTLVTVNNVLSVDPRHAGAIELKRRIERRRAPTK
jgi:hypothetical protein